MGERMEEHWHNLSIEDSLVAQGSSESGIAAEEVIQRRKAYGLNKLDEPEKTSALLRFLSQYNDPLNYLLIGAARGSCHKTRSPRGCHFHLHRFNRQRILWLLAGKSS